MSRFIPHPPNFTSLIALSFYVPALFGFRYLPALLISFVITDYIIGFHNTVFFTWGSVIIIAIISKYFSNSILTRISGALTGAVIFYLITNLVFGLEECQPNLQGLTVSYIMGLPFLDTVLFQPLYFQH